jgi:hypothetical protein
MPTEQFFSYTMASEINWNSPAGKTNYDLRLIRFISGILGFRNK